MIKEIPKPSFEEIVCNWDSSGTLAGFNFNKLNDWFDQTIEPLNKLIREGQTVYGSPDACEDTPIAECWYNDTPRGHTHKALLIGIEPIKKESCADVLKDLEKIIHRGKRTKDGVTFYNCGFNNSNPQETYEILLRAKAALANERAGFSNLTAHAPNKGSDT